LGGFLKSDSDPEWLTVLTSAASIDNEININGGDDQLRLSYEGLAA
jgi:hypothetical protein